MNKYPMIIKVESVNGKLVAIDSQNNDVTISNDGVYPDITFNHTAQEPGLCSTETFELDLRVDFCKGSHNQTIPVDVVCCGTSQ